MTPFRGIRTSIERGTARYHNVHTRIVTGLVSRSVPMPAAAKSVCAGNISSTPKPWQAFAQGITDLQASPAVELHPRHFVRGEQGVGHESVAIEDGVVHSHLVSIA